MKTCKRCKETYSWHNWAQSPYCSPYCKRGYDFEEKDSGVLIIDGITQAAKNAQRGHEKDILQPVRKDGTFNPEFVAAHGTKSLEKEYKIKKEHILTNVAKYG